MEWNLERRTTTTISRTSCVDRLTSLPDELLGRILSLLKTKDVAAMQVLSKRMGTALSFVTNVDLDDSPLSLYVDCALLDQRFPLFESFVNNVLQRLLHFNKGLTRFRLHFGGHKTMQDSEKRWKGCYPNMEPARLNAWISYPLTHYGLKELDLCFHVKNRNDFKLPPPLFVAQSLEVLKLDSILEIDDCAHIPVISLPNLKLLNLPSFIFSEDDFVTRLVSSCPVLEDLSITCCWWKKSDHLTISSHSLRRLTLYHYKCVDEEKNSDLVLFDTPNLQYLYYLDNLAFRYSLAPMNALVDASIDIHSVLQFDPFEASFESLLGLLKLFSHVPRLSLLGYFPEFMYFAADTPKDRMPVLRNLRTLKLDSLLDSRWDFVLLPILDCSPFLETLIFPEGLIRFLPCHGDEVEAGALEADSWRRTETVPSCCLTHLKRIEVGYCYGIDRELNMIKFLLGKASVLKELSISLISMSNTKYCSVERQLHPPNLEQFERTVRESPRASNSCSITVIMLL